MSVLPHDGVALILVVFLLGLQHGMDPDHIATIDAGAQPASSCLAKASNE